MLLLNLFFSEIVFTYQTRIHAHTHFQHSLQFIAHKDNKREILLHVIQSKRWNIAFGPWSPTASIATCYFSTLSSIHSLLFSILLFCVAKCSRILLNLFWRALYKETPKKTFNTNRWRFGWQMSKRNNKGYLSTVRRSDLECNFQAGIFTFNLLIGDGLWKTRSVRLSSVNNRSLQLIWYSKNGSSE